MYLRYTPYTCADTSMYLFMRGMAVMYWTPGGISNIRQRLRIPRAFIAGVIARHIAPFPLEGSETTRLVVNGSMPLSAHSTEAKKLLRSMHMNMFCSIVPPPIHLFAIL